MCASLVSQSSVSSPANILLNLGSFELNRLVSMARSNATTFSVAYSTSGVFALLEQFLVHGCSGGFTYFESNGHSLQSEILLHARAQEALQESRQLASVTKKRKSGGTRLNLCRIFELKGATGGSWR